MLAREPASFWQENVIVVVILLQVFARMSWWRKRAIKCLSFCDFATGRGLNLRLSITDNSANFSGAKKYYETFRGVHFLRSCEKNLMPNLVLESKVLNVLTCHKQLLSSEELLSLNQPDQGSNRVCHSCYLLLT